MTENHITVGMMVAKPEGDYRFSGEVVSVFKKKSGVVRAVVENDEGILHIFSPSQLVDVLIRLDSESYNDAWDELLKARRQGTKMDVSNAALRLCLEAQTKNYDEHS